MKMKRIEIIIGLVIVLGFSGQARADDLDKYLENLYGSHIIPGFSVVVVMEDQVIFNKGYGLETIDGNKPMTSNTSTAIGSLAKSFTALAMMQLVEEGKVKLDDPVVKHLPWFRTANKTVSDQITIRMLLNNTSGLMAPAVRNRDISDQAVEKLMRSMESVYLRDEPGTHYEYSNDGFALAGLLISKISGMSYESYLDKSVFTPLEMDRTTNDPEKFDALQVLYGHQPGIDRAIPLYREDDILQEYVAAGSRLRSSSNDIGHYLLAMLNGGTYKGKQIVSPESIDEMWQSYSEFPGISEEDGGGNLPFHYGLGWFTGEMDGKQYIFHGGNRRNMSSMTFLYPEKKMGVSILANIDLTLIDRYTYPNLINIMNNIVRISLEEPVSDFAIPTVPDPTLNKYSLPDSKKVNYTGEYILSAGNDWVYLGSQLSILEGANGLLGVIKKGEQLIEELQIDFITQKTAVSRNLTMPREIQFKFLSKGKTSDVFIEGKKYSRLTEGYYSKFNLVASSQNSVRFYFPGNWNLKWLGDAFYGTDPDLSGETIKSQVFHMEHSFAKYFHEMFPDHHIIHSGQNLSEILGSHYWKEMAIVSSKGGKKYQHFLCVTKKENKSYVIAFTSQHNLTKGVTNLIPTLLSTFSWKQ